MYPLQSARCPGGRYSWLTSCSTTDLLLYWGYKRLFYKQSRWSCFTWRHICKTCCRLRICLSHRIKPSLLTFLSASSFFFFLPPCCKFPSLLQGSLVEIFNRGYETDSASHDLIYEHEAVWKSLRDRKWKIMKQVFFTPETQNLPSVGFHTFPFLENLHPPPPSPPALLRSDNILTSPLHSSPTLL